MQTIRTIPGAGLVASFFPFDNCCLVVYCAGGASITDSQRLWVFDPDCEF